MAENAQPAASQRLFAQMMRDIMAGGQAADPAEQVGPRVCRADARLRAAAKGFVTSSQQQTPLQQWVQPASGASAKP